MNIRKLHNDKFDSKKAALVGLNASLKISIIPEDMLAAAKDIAVFGRAFLSNAVRIRLYIDTYQEYQKHLDALLEALHNTVDQLKGTTVYGQISLLQSLHGIDFLSAVVLVAEMGSFELFSSI